MQKSIYFILLFFVVACGSSSDSGGTADDGDDAATSGLEFVSEGDFDSSASAASTAISALIKNVTTRTCDDVDTEDQFNPDIQDGLDCDGDGGVVAHITPSQYVLAIKRATLFSDDEGTEDIEILPDTGTLALSEVVDFTPTETSAASVTVDPADLSAGIYDGVEMEIYYFQLTFEVGGVTQNVRIYMSDDDFPSEGSLGHHQGDITFIDDDGTELGWIDFTWDGDALASSHGDDQNGAGGEDAETLHDRGFFGNDEFWDIALFDQGADQDLYIYQMLFAESLEIPDPDTITDLTTITATFSIADTFFYEDFDPIGTGFSGGDGSDAVAETGGWAPLEPTATLTIE